jgi:hypothetical protein
MSIKYLFEQRYPLRDEIYYNITYRKKHRVIKGVDYDKYRENDYFTLEDVHINANRTVIALRIRLDNIYMTKEYYGNEDGLFFWDIHESFSEKYKGLLKYLGNPKIIVDVVNENEVPENYRVRLTLQK